jgi:hypothetical protein
MRWNCISQEREEEEYREKMEADQIRFHYEKQINPDLDRSLFFFSNGYNIGPDGRVLF